MRVRATLLHERRDSLPCCVIEACACTVGRRRSDHATAEAPIALPHLMFTEISGAPTQARLQQAPRTIDRACSFSMSRSCMAASVSGSSAYITLSDCATDPRSYQCKHALLPTLVTESAAGGGAGRTSLPSNSDSLSKAKVFASSALFVSKKVACKRGNTFKEPYPNALYDA